MGDGLLVLWDCEKLKEVSVRNIIIALFEICRNYSTDLLNDLNSLIVDPPPALRCGIARGTVFSVGDGSDYVGSCINMAARLQKLPGVSCIFNHRGVDTHDVIATDFFKEDITIQKVFIRGIGEN